MYLVLNGPDANSQTRRDSALQSASCSAVLGWVRFLLEQGADIDARIVGNYNGLQCASRSGHLHIVSFLLTKGANANAQREEHKTSLCVASQTARSDTLLLEDLPIHTFLYEEEILGSALYFVSSFSHSDTVTRLIEDGADLNVPGGHAAVNRRRDSIIEFFQNSS